MRGFLDGLGIPTPIQTCSPCHYGASKHIECRTGAQAWNLRARVRLGLWWCSTISGALRLPAAVITLSAAHMRIISHILRAVHANSMHWQRREENLPKKHGSGASLPAELDQPSVQHTHSVFDAKGLNPSYMVGLPIGPKQS